jgi:peptidoglycan/xylan/chitin deacetylase (PgdA/CDA1 family)
VDSDDAGNACTWQQVYQNVVDGVQGKDYSVVLMHDTRDYTIEAVEKIIQWGLDNGYTFQALEPSSPTCHHGWMKN